MIIVCNFRIAKITVLLLKENIIIIKCIFAWGSPLYPVMRWRLNNFPFSYSTSLSLEMCSSRAFSIWPWLSESNDNIMMVIFVNILKQIKQCLSWWRHGMFFWEFNNFSKTQPNTFMGHSLIPGLECRQGFYVKYTHFQIPCESENLACWVFHIIYPFVFQQLYIAQCQVSASSRFYHNIKS